MCPPIAQAPVTLAACRDAGGVGEESFQDVRSDQRQSNIKVGLLVERAKDPAAAAGVQRGDIVVAANGLALSNVDDFRNVLLRCKGHIALLVQRGASRIFVPVRIG